ncbi:MAG: hypothetical protein JO053_16300 [Acidobacteria bacterium]|nr:hypothetical protein [Acidobacteriota bacterium]
MKYAHIILVLLCCSAAALSQSRDYATNSEDEIIREAQQIDLRIDALTHMADRRFAVLKIDVAAPAKKENDAWGPLPEGTRLQLLDDIRRIVQKAIDDIDNLAERPQSMQLDTTHPNQKPKTYQELFPSSVKKLGAAAKRWEPALKIEAMKTKDPVEQGMIANTIDLCDQIIEALAKVK